MNAVIGSEVVGDASDIAGELAQVGNACARHSTSVILVCDNYSFIAPFLTRLMF